MENNPTRVSRERINENYLRQMLREDTRGRGCGSCERQERPERPCRMSTPACEGMGGGRVSLAMVYAPRQSWRMIYDGEKALVKGTIFGELDKPFLGYGKARGCEVRR